mmetsp:Transcript_116674/g.341525  ORF Transcript_116674/g.341525 Transcript_116674/m.341525 type:complete len:207 (+) Transcript_116674:574-1194(+)
MVVEPVDAPPALLAVVRPHPPPHAAHDADLLEVTLLDERQVLATALCQQPFYAHPADALTRCPLTLLEHEGRALELRLPRHRGVTVVHRAAHQRLQLGAARLVAAAIVSAQSLSCLRDELALVVELVLLKLHALQIVVWHTLLVNPIVCQTVVVRHLRFDWLLGIECSYRVASDFMALCVNGARLNPPRICGAVLNPEEQGGAHKR